MSNYAPDPLKEQVYTNLQNVTLSTVSANDIQKLTDPTFLQATNQDALLTYNLINQAMMRNDSAPLPNKGQVVQTSGDSDRIQFRPAVGEVWKLNGGDILSTSGTFTVGFQLRDAAGNIAFIGKSSSTGQEPITVDEFFEGELFITNSLYLYTDVQAGEGRVSTALVQIR